MPSNFFLSSSTCLAIPDPRFPASPRPWNWLQDWWSICLDQTTPPSLQNLCAKIIYFATRDPENLVEVTVGPYMPAVAYKYRSELRQQLHRFRYFNVMELFNKIRAIHRDVNGELVPTAIVNLAVPQNPAIAKLGLPKKIQNYLEITRQEPQVSCPDVLKYSEYQHKEIAVIVPVPFINSNAWFWCPEQHLAQSLKCKESYCLKRVSPSLTISIKLLKRKHRVREEISVFGGRIVLDIFQVLPYAVRLGPP